MDRMRQPSSESTDAAVDVPDAVARRTRGGAGCIFGGSVNNPLFLTPALVAGFSLLQTQALLWEVWLKRLDRLGYEVPKS